MRPKDYWSYFRMHWELKTTRQIRSWQERKWFDSVDFVSQMLQIQCSLYLQTRTTMLQKHLYWGWTKYRMHHRQTQMASVVVAVGLVVAPAAAVAAAAVMHQKHRIQSTADCSAGQAVQMHQTLTASTMTRLAQTHELSARAISARNGESAHQKTQTPT